MVQSSLELRRAIVRTCPLETDTRKTLDVGARWKAATSEGGKAGEDPSDAFEWTEFLGMQHQFLSDVQWKKVLQETRDALRGLCAKGGDAQPRAPKPPKSATRPKLGMPGKAKRIAPDGAPSAD